MLRVPRIVNVLGYAVLLFFVLAYANESLGHGWPDEKDTFCWPPRGNGECEKARAAVKGLMGVGAGVGLVLGCVLLFSSLFLFWVGI